MQHVPDLGLQCVEDPFHIDRHHAVELRFGHLLDRELRRRHPGVVKGNFKPAKGVDTDGDQVEHLPPVRHIRFAKSRPAAARFDQAPRHPCRLVAGVYSMCCGGRVGPMRSWQA